MTPDKTRDKFNYVGDTTNLTHANLLFLVHKIICNDNDELTSQAAVAAIHVDPKNESIDDSLNTPIGKFINKFDQDKISIALCPGRLEKIDGVDQITGDTHWTGLHLRRITRDDGFISFKAYYMDSLWDKDNANFNSFYKVPEPVIRVLESFKGIGGVDFEVVKVKCDRQTDGYSCGYHAVCNLQAMHSLEIKGDEVIDLTTSTNVDKFIKDERAFLKTEFNGDLDTKLRDARTKRGKGEKQGEGSEEYLVKFLEIFSSNEFNNLDKLKKIIQIEDEVNQIKDATNLATISSFLEFEKYYELFLCNFALDLQNKCSLKQELISEDEGVLSKRDIFFTKLTTEEVVKDPRKFLEILTAIDKNPKSIDTIGEIETDEKLKVKINESKNLFINYFYKDNEVTEFATAVNEIFNDTATTSFKNRLDQLVVLSKSDSFPGELKNSFDFLSKVDDKNFLPAIIPDRYQLIPKEKFKGWGLKAVFKGMDLKIEGKEVSQILDERGNDILPELKKTFKDDPKLFAHAVTDFFRRAQEHIDLVYNDKTIKRLDQGAKKSIKIVDGEVQDAIDGEPEADNSKLFIDRMKLYSDNSATKTPGEITEVDAPPPAGPSLVPPPAPQPPKPPQDRKYNLNLGANNIKKYGFLGVDDSGGDKSGEVNANNFIIVDPAGTAFEDLNYSGDLSGGGASGALYGKSDKLPGPNNFRIRPTMEKGKSKKGITINDNRQVVVIEPGYAVYNDQYKHHQNRLYYGIIHAVGPNNKGEKQEELLTLCLKNVFIEYHEEASKVAKEENRPGLRIPAISGSIYRNVMYDENGRKRLDENGKTILQSDDDYNAMLIRAIENGHKMACEELEGKEITFGKHGLEICMYSQKMYNSMIENIKASPSPIPSPRGSKPMALTANGVKEVEHA